jgi:hypothetical protein
MVQGCYSTRLLLKAPQSLSVGSEGRGENFLTSTRISFDENKAVVGFVSQNAVPKFSWVRVFGHNVAETPGMSAALSFRIPTISSRLPGTTVSFAINPYIPLASP